MVDRFFTSQQVLNTTKTFIESLSVNEDGELIVKTSGALSGVKGIYAEFQFTATEAGVEIPLPESGVIFYQFWGDHNEDIYLSTKTEGVLGPRAKIQKKAPTDIGPIIIGPDCPNFVSGAGHAGTVTVWIVE
jgi:hypothetical protein